MPPPCGAGRKEEMMGNYERSEPAIIRRVAAGYPNSNSAYRLYAICKMLNIALLPCMDLFLWQTGKVNLLYLPMMYIDFYERVKSLVKAKKTTIEYVVGEAGLSLASYNAYRRHKNLPRADEALKIAQTLDTTVEYLIAGIVSEASTSNKALEEIQVILNKYFNKAD
jgi:hypothetical protein